MGRRARGGVALMADAMPEQLEHDINAVLTILMTRAPERAHEIERFRMAAAQRNVCPQILYKRFQVLVDNAMSGPERYEFAKEEKYEIGQLLLALSEWASLGKPGPKARGNEYRLMIYLNRAEHYALAAHCERENTTRAAVIRRAIREAVGPEAMADAYAQAEARDPEAEARAEEFADSER